MGEYQVIVHFGMADPINYLNAVIIVFQTKDQYKNKKHGNKSRLKMWMEDSCLKIRNVFVTTDNLGFIIGVKNSKIIPLLILVFI